jgi:hypothetical protein
VVEVLDGCDVVCVARNDALLDGLLTVFHVERSRCVWNARFCGSSSSRGAERPLAAACLHHTGLTDLCLLLLLLLPLPTTAKKTSDELLNLQNDLPLLSDYDKECIISLAVVS